MHIKKIRNTKKKIFDPITGFVDWFVIIIFIFFGCILRLLYEFIVMIPF